MSSTRAQALHNEAVVLVRSGQLLAASDRLSAAVHCLDADRVDVRTLKALWQVALELEDWPTAIAAGFKAGRRDPLDFAFVDRVLRSLLQCPSSALTGADPEIPARMPAQPPSLTIVIVSQDDERFAAVEAEYARAFTGWPHQRVRIKGATSMYDGYARGFAASKGEIVVFSHDDIRFAVADFPARLAAAMADSDLVGVAGTTRVSGPALLWSGHPHVHGAITHKSPADAQFEFAVTSLEGPHIVGAQGLDGVFIAARREWIERVGFDVDGIRGFHLYDLDFSYRAHLAGARVTIACDLGLIHASRGTFDNRWDTGSREFATKFPLLAEAPGEHRHWYALPLADETTVRRMHEKLRWAWALPAP